MYTYTRCDYSEYAVDNIKEFNEHLNSGLITNVKFHHP